MVRRRTRPMPRWRNRRTLAIMRHNVLIYGGTLHGDRFQIARNAVSGQFPSVLRSDQLPACRATHREYNTHVNIARRDLFKYAAMAGAAALGQEHRKASTTTSRMPGPFPGLVVGVE